ncbi:MAG: glutaredoxin [bacterium]|jgi:glutaredoxin|nr:glutaredoxin [bacterium]
MPILVWLLLAWDALTGRRPLARDAEAQARVDADTSKLALYHFQACPYCRKVRRDIRLLGLDIEQRDIEQDRSRRDELVAGGGKKQVPCLRIVEPGGAVRWLYESRGITRYLNDRFGASA